MNIHYSTTIDLYNRPVMTGIEVVQGDIDVNIHDITLTVALKSRLGGEAHANKADTTQ